MNFKKVSFEEKDNIDVFLKKYGENSCQHSFVSMFIFNDKYEDEYVIEDDFLFIHRRGRDTEGHRVYLFPIGDTSNHGNVRRAITKLINDAHEYGKKLCFETLTENAKDITEKCFDDSFAIYSSRDMAEYVYSKELMDQLTGRALSEKRNRVRAFWSNYDTRVRIEKITKDNIEDVKGFQKRWCDNYNDGKGQPIAVENAAIMKGLENFKKLDLRGIAIYVDNEIRAYAFGAELSSECVDEIAEKADKDFVGLYQTVTNEFAKRCCKDYKYINREEDLGIEGLRTAKLRYRPEYLINKYILIEK